MIHKTFVGLCAAFLSGGLVHAQTTIVRVPGVHVQATAPGTYCVDGTCYQTVPTAVPVAPTQYVCPQCGKLHTRTAPSAPSVAPVRTAVQTVARLPGQAVAQARADYMARTGRRGHPPRSVGGGFASVGGFEGVGWTSRRGAARTSIGTCRPSGRSGPQDDTSSALVGDAVSHGPGGSYRVRIWQRATGRQRRIGGFFRRR